jgi:hypothetical protein
MSEFLYAILAMVVIVVECLTIYVTLEIFSESDEYIG